MARIHFEKLEYFYSSIDKKPSEFGGNKARGYMMTQSIHNSSALGRICTNRFFNFDVFFKQQFLSYITEHRCHSFRGHSAVLTG